MSLLAKSLVLEVFATKGLVFSKAVMPDFGSRWLNPELLQRGGQALTYKVTDADDPNRPIRVAKILNNPKEDRKARFLREIEVTETFDHPNVVRSLGRGETAGRKYPFFVMPLYQRGTLEECYPNLGTPLERAEALPGNLRRSQLRSRRGTNSPT